MCFLSNFGCEIIFMCFDYFGHLRDSKSFCNGRIGHLTSWFKWPIVVVLAPVVQTLDSAIHRINYYPVDSVIDIRNTYRLDSDLSGG